MAIDKILEKNAQKQFPLEFHEVIFSMRMLADKYNYFQFQLS